MSKHNLDFVPQEIGAYAEYPIVQWSLRADSAAAEYDRAVDPEVGLFAEIAAGYYVGEAETAVASMRANFREDLLVPGTQEAIEPILGRCIKLSIAGKHAFDPALEGRSDIKQKGKDQSWLDWLANDAPDVYVVDCPKIFADVQREREQQNQELQEKPQS